MLLLFLVKFDKVVVVGVVLFCVNSTQKVGLKALLEAVLLGK